MAAADDIPLPRGWSKSVRSSVLHAISVAFTAVTRAWASASTSPRRTTRLHADLDRAQTEIALLNEELAVKNDRLDRMPPRRRPHYSPIHRMRILQLKAARGWSTAQTADVFAVTEDTIVSWLQRTDEEGDRALVQTAEPVNKYPGFVGDLVRRLKTLCPAMGKKRIAQVLAPAGLHLGTSTVGRILRQQPDRNEAAEEEMTIEETISTRSVKAKQPNHIWHVDLTAVPTAAGFWVPWSPFSKLQRWPFCWWVAVVIDHFSRRVSGFALFASRPTSKEVCELLDRVMQRTGSKPKHLITDKGRQFFCRTFTDWCSRRDIQPRFGALGKHGSIAIIERFFRSMKSECTRWILVPLGLDAMRRELACYATRYNQHRPHQSLAGLTPAEVCMRSVSQARAVRLEPRLQWPMASDRQQTRAARIHVLVEFHEGRRHLPVVELKRAA